MRSYPEFGWSARGTLFLISDPAPGHGHLLLTFLGCHVSRAGWRKSRAADLIPEDVFHSLLCRRSQRTAPVGNDSPKLPPGLVLLPFPITATCPACPSLPWGLPWITRSRRSQKNTSIPVIPKSKGLSSKHPKGYPKQWGAPLG